jgi:hypothetical protein
VAEQEQLDEKAAGDLAKAMAKELADLRLDFTTYDDYYNGLQALPTEPKRLTQAYKELLTMATSNWCRLVVDVVAERLRVGKITTSANQNGDSEAWKVWQANNLDARQLGVYVEALKCGVSYVSVWPNPESSLPPLIRGESPMQVHVRHDEITGEALYAVKVWQGRDNFVYVTLYDQNNIYRFKSAQAGEAAEVFTARLTTRSDIAQIDLKPRTDDDDGGWLIPNPTKGVPFTAFYNQPDLMGGYSSELQGIIPLQDRINRTTFHRLLTQEFHAFPQRWVTGIDVDTDESGNPIQPFASEVDRLWVAVSESTKFGQFGSADPSGFLSSITADIQAMATQSRTPPHYLMAGMGQFPSGESVRATEYGLHRKVQDRQVTFGEAWEEVVRKAATIQNNTTVAEDIALSVGWDAVEARTEGEIADVLLKMSTLGVPRKVLWERWGATPDEAQRWMDEATEEAQRIASLDAISNGVVPGAEGMALGEAGPPEVRDEPTA